MVSNCIPLLVLFILGCDALRLPASRAIQYRRTQNFDNFILTNANQTLFYAPTTFGSPLEIRSILSTTSDEILLPSHYASQISGFTDQGISTTAGKVVSGSVRLANKVVQNQDVVLYSTRPAAQNDTVSSLSPSDLYASFGLGTNSHSGASFTSHVLAQSPNSIYYTVLLQPDIFDWGTDEVFGGIITFGEVIDLAAIFQPPSYEVQDAPDLKNVTSYPELQYGGVAEIVIDALNGPNGPILLTSNSPVPVGKTTARIDMAQQFNLVNPDVAKSIYGSLPEARLLNGLWYASCTELTASFSISGHVYHISPLQMMIPVNKTTCVGTFRDKTDLSRGDIVLGSQFLKNVYALFGYKSPDLSGPYIQLMPLTDPVDAHDDWVTSSWGSLSGGYGGGMMSLTGAMPAASSDKSALGSLGDAISNSSDNAYWTPSRRLSAIISGAVLGGLLLMGIAIWCCVRRRRHDSKGSYSTVHDDDHAAAFSVHVPLNNAVEGVGELPTLPYKD